MHSQKRYRLDASCGFYRLDASLSSSCIKPDGFIKLSQNQTRAVARTLMGGGGGVFIHIFMLCPTSFFSD